MPDGTVKADGSGEIETLNCGLVSDCFKSSSSDEDNEKHRFNQY